MQEETLTSRTTDVPAGRNVAADDLDSGTGPGKPSRMGPRSYPTGGATPALCLSARLAAGIRGRRSIVGSWFTWWGLTAQGPALDCRV